MTRETVTFPSARAGETVKGYFYPPRGEARAIVQISHGMMDYIGRYEEMIEALSEAGFAVVGNDHLGHGETAVDLSREPLDRSRLGHFGPRGSWRYLVEDLHTMSGLARERFLGAPLFLLGHSMGSFVARLYAARYGEELRGLILLGTAAKRRFAAVGGMLAPLVSLFYGEEHRSKFLTKTTFGSFHTRFRAEGTHAAWLTSDPAQRVSDPLCRFRFSAASYGDLYEMMRRMNRRSWFASLPKGLAVLLSSGSMDPLGGYGKGVTRLFSSLRRSGRVRPSIKLYEGARHELHHEVCRAEFFSDLAAFIDKEIS